MNEKISLSELQLIIRDSLYMALPEMYWVIAEISELNENSAGHCYLELIEKNPAEKNVTARIKAIIWSSKYRFLKSLFENITGETIREGLKILVKAKIEYHEIYGLSLVITDIDPAFTIGELAMKRQQIIHKLEMEGVFSMNKEIELPAFPRRIAIISSKNAAGYTDFMNHLLRNNFGYVFYTALFESAMQGAETEEGVINALNRIAENLHLFDLVAIIRGGGSQSDLSWFDSYNLAYHVTQFPLPVLTGIGHEKDMSVTDLVANKALKTPTAVADFIIDCLAQGENNITETFLIIRDLSRTIIERNRVRLDSTRLKLQPLTRVMIASMKESISEKIIEIINIGKKFTFSAGRMPANQTNRLISSVKSFSQVRSAMLARNYQSLKNMTLNYIEKKKANIETKESTLNILNPYSVLRRGYTITSLNGKIVKNKEGLNLNDIIDTEFYDGNVKSRVVEKKE